MPRLKVQKLSNTGFFSQLDAMKLGTEPHRNFTFTRVCWECFLQPMLLQHYIGTTGFRVEKMLTSLVAQKYEDHKGN